MFFEATPEFWNAYDQLSNSAISEVDIHLRRILDTHNSAWARSGRIRGESDAWIARFRVAGEPHNVYWSYKDDATILFIALVVAP